MNVGIPSPKQRAMVSQVKQLVAFDPLPADTRDLVITILKNIVNNHPDNAKYCSIKLDNAKFKEKIASNATAMKLLQTIGFITDGVHCKLAASTTLHDVQEFKFVIEMVRAMFVTNVI